MYTLKGIFPEPKKEQKRNFIRENMRQVKLLQEKSTTNQPKFTVKTGHPQRPPNQLAASGSLGELNSPSNKSGKNAPTNPKPNIRKKINDVKIKKGDMAEFLKRKEQRQQKPTEESDDEVKSTESSGRLRDMACQTVESTVDSSKLTVLYPRKDDKDFEMKASGDNARQLQQSISGGSPQRSGDASEAERRSRLNSFSETKTNNVKDPYLPTGYQKGVVPKYLRVRREEEEVVCPPGHVTLPDHERRETLRMLRNSFAELVSELNKMPVKTDTLRMRNRKMELEKQLTKLEEGIKVFSRPKVFVKIGE